MTLRLLSGKKNKQKFDVAQIAPHNRSASNVSSSLFHDGFGPGSMANQQRKRNLELSGVRCDGKLVEAVLHRVEGLAEVAIDKPAK